MKTKRAIEEIDVPREDVFVTTKLWIQDAGYESTKRAFERSLERLGLDYLDPVSDPSALR